ncbi:hypothetical protein D3C71_1308360 [compost metagenome]
MSQRAALFQQVAVDLARHQQGRKHRLPIQPNRRIKQAVIPDNALTFVPEQLTVATDIQLRLKMPEVEAFAAGRATQSHHVPVEQACVAFQVNRGAEFSLRRTENDRLLRQPFQCRTGRHSQVQPLIGGTGCAIPLGRAGAGDLRPGVAADAGRDVQSITTGNPARRVDDDVLTDFRPFGIQVLLHAQGAKVTALDRARAVAEAGVAQLQLGVPARGEQHCLGR